MFLNASTRGSVLPVWRNHGYRSRVQGPGVANFKNLQTPASTGWRVVVPVWPEGVAGEPANFCLQGREKPEAPQGQGWSLPSLDFYMSATLRTEPSCTWGALGVVSGL